MTIFEFFFDHLRNVDSLRENLRLVVEVIDLQLMVFFYPRRAENRTFRPPVTQKQKNNLNFKKG
jgi:hypothetical protein